MVILVRLEVLIIEIDGTYFSRQGRELISSSLNEAQRDLPIGRSCRY